MEPGRELDKLVAEAIGYSEFKFKGLTMMPDSSPYFSTEWVAAGPAWEWLEKNHPWNGFGLVLTTIARVPSVYLLSVWDLIKPVATGQTYPHAIALAVVKAAKEMGVRDGPK